MADLSKMTDWAKLQELLQKNTEKGKERKVDRQELLEHLKSRVKGQDHVLEDAAKLIALQSIKTDRVKPIASMLFLGPTGTGKTEVAKAIAEYLFKDEKNMIRFDCSELGNPDLSKTRLIGSPDVYRGSRGGELTQPILANPHRVVVFDEIEKAHPSVFDLFLQMLGEGRLTDQHSNKIADFTQSMVILTSNAQFEEIAKIQEGMNDYYEMVNAVKTQLAESKAFRPEILGRIDRIYVFKSLEPMVMAEIALLQIKKLAKQYSLTVDFVAPELLMQTLISSGKVRKFGARAQEQVINDTFCEPLAAARADRARKVTFDVGHDGSLVVKPAFDE